jgi:hypothetical protein
VGLTPLNKRKPIISPRARSYKQDKNPAGRKRFIDEECKLLRLVPDLGASDLQIKITA